MEKITKTGLIVDTLVQVHDDDAREFCRRCALSMHLRSSGPRTMQRSLESFSGISTPKEPVNPVDKPDDDGELLAVMLLPVS